jgi:hypothetical protein
MVCVQTDARVSSVNRTVVEKKKKDVLPMRFKIAAPEGYAPSSSRRNSKGVEAMVRYMQCLIHLILSMLEGRVCDM